MQARQLLVLRLAMDLLQKSAFWVYWLVNDEAHDDEKMDFFNRGHGLDAGLAVVTSWQEGKVHSTLKAKYFCAVL